MLLASSCRRVLLPAVLVFLGAGRIVDPGQIRTRLGRAGQWLQSGSRRSSQKVAGVFGPYGTLVSERLLPAFFVVVLARRAWPPRPKNSLA